LEGDDPGSLQLRQHPDCGYLWIRDPESSKAHPGSHEEDLLADLSLLHLQHIYRWVDRVRTYSPVINVVTIPLTSRRPYDDTSLQISTGTAQQSPFTIAFQRSGVSVVPSIINAVVLTSAVSAASACVFIASRTLYGLSCDGHAPKIMQRCNRLGVPYYAVGTTCALLPLVYLNVANNTSVVFGWFVNITTTAGLIGWAIIEVTYIRFFNGLKAQGYSRNG
jgi:amino acid permease